MDNEATCVSQSLSVVHQLSKVFGHNMKHIKFNLLTKKVEIFGEEIDKANISVIFKHKYCIFGNKRLVTNSVIYIAYEYQYYPGREHYEKMFRGY